MVGADSGALAIAAFLGHADQAGALRPDAVVLAGLPGRAATTTAPGRTSWTSAPPPRRAVGLFRTALSRNRSMSLT
ncbi:hypothetical protein ACIP98_40545 [Streptomyces sp. NPDC088354]|uniref:hypothetical protein n=1 Tax=Streptomyces sp. NPDC088354 TaxID=3365856 RepID=UPI00381FC2F6